jgi:hypothetical protein
MHFQTGRKPTFSDRCPQRIRFQITRSFMAHSPTSNLQNLSENWAVGYAKLRVLDAGTPLLQSNRHAEKL